MCTVNYDESQGVVILHAATSKTCYILLTNDAPDWLAKLGITTTPSASDRDEIGCKGVGVSFAALGEL